MTQNLIDIRSLEKQQIERIFKTADVMRGHLMRGEKSLGLLKGKHVMTVFYENSTRTRISFETAARYLGAHVTDIPIATSSVKKGETLIDTAKTLDRFEADLIVIRHPSAGAPKILAENVQAKVINGGDGLHAHPTQALYDLYTVKQHFQKITGLKVAIIGDIKHSRVARSNIEIWNKFGITPVVYGPGTLMPEGVELLGVKVADSLEEALSGADVVMGLRIQKERMRKGLLPSMGEFAAFYGINEKNIGLASPHAIVLHPGPVNRDVELSNGLIESERCKKDEQAGYGLAVRMAVMAEMLGGDV